MKKSIFVAIVALTMFFVSCSNPSSELIQAQSELKQCRDSLNQYKGLYGDIGDNIRVKLTFKSAIQKHYLLASDKYYYQALVSEGNGKPDFRVAIEDDLPIDTSITYIVRKGVIIEEWGIPIIREAGK